MQKQPPPQAESNNVEMAFNLLYLLASGHTTCLTPFMRCDMGSQWPGKKGVVAIFLLLLYGANANSLGMYFLVILWFGTVLYHRIRGFKSRIKQHSQYEGWPWLAMRVPGVRDELFAKSIIEAAICMIAGAFICVVSVPLGQFILVGVISFPLKGIIESAAREAQVRRMRDAYLEQRQLSDDFRNMK